MVAQGNTGSPSDDALSAAIYTLFSSNLMWNVAGLEELFDLPIIFPKSRGVPKLVLPSSRQGQAAQYLEENLFKVSILEPPFVFRNEDSMHTARPHTRPPKINRINVLRIPRESYITYPRILCLVNVVPNGGDGVHIAEYVRKLGLLDSRRGTKDLIRTIAHEALYVHCDILTTLESRIKQMVC